MYALGNSKASQGTLWGNDVSDDEAEAPILSTREVVKPQASHKKADVNPRADKTKAKKFGKKPVTGNEAGSKFSNKNRDVEGPRSTFRKGSKDKKFDRHSRTGRSETGKSQHNKLGDEAESQIEAEADAEAEIEEDEVEEEEQPVLTSAADYFSQLEQQQAQFGSKPKAAAINAKLLKAEKIVKEREEFIPATAVKKTRTKAKKEKIYVDADIKVASSSDRPPRGDRRGGRGDRGDRRGGRGDRRGGRGGRGERAPKDSKPAASAPASTGFDESKFPAL
ncbi:unnamed protein product [Ambrosiozyma monospora]|uniref:Unnamed protein product n=1 Tax=Ambrosiozyma monospora TaxID=43982 RepID=A0A9W7DEJ9_AMBMO|nr:unnamed protein product [Ambrosiozyma monospora]